ncbi:DedA family protein [Streptomyces sp. NBC_01341]|uniref:DedA family protein n=1 Tax=Streptomyces sp. NBC_01341 TaxID=2903831 RepID=UPI002E0FFDCA|nr:DedA family protein [Streptomyces sp. NBC_01341]
MQPNSLIEAAGWWSYAVVFLLTAAETSAFVGLLIPGETAVLIAAAIAGRGDLNGPLLAVVVVAGAVTGDHLGFALGRRCARRPARGRGRAFSGGTRSGRTSAFLRRHGGAAVFTGKFVGFVRTFLPYAAGFSGMPYRRYVLYSTAASVVWGTGSVLLGYYAGAAAIEFVHSTGLAGAGALAAVGVPALIVAKILARRRNRALPAASAIVASGGPRRPALQGAAREFTPVQES